MITPRAIADNDLSIKLLVIKQYSKKMQAAIPKINSLALIFFFG